MESRQPRQGFARHPLPLPPDHASTPNRMSYLPGQDQPPQQRYQHTDGLRFGGPSQEEYVRSEGPTAPGSRLAYPGTSSYHQHAVIAQLPTYAAAPTQQAYNPLRYAQMTPPTSSYAVPMHNSPTRTYQLPQTYNPALYQENAIAEATNRSYGTISGGFSTQSSPARPNSRFQATSTQIPYANENYSPIIQNARNTSGAGNHRYTSSGPLPSLSFPQSQTAPTQNSSPRGSPKRNRTPSPYASLQPSPHKSPSPYTRDNPSPSIFENPVDYSSYRSEGNSPVPSTTCKATPDRHQVARSIRSGHSSGRHPQSRPLPGLPPEDDFDLDQEEDDEDLDVVEGEYHHQDELFSELGELVGLPRVERRLDFEGGSRGETQYSSRRLPSPLLTGMSSQSLRHQNTSAFHGARGSSSPVKAPEVEEYPDDSDAEAEAGLAAMRAADEQDRLEDSRRQSGIGSLFYDRAPYKHLQQDEMELQSPVLDDHYGVVDVASLAGGYVPIMSYGHNTADPMTQESVAHLNGRQVSTSSRSSNPRDLDGMPIRTSSNTSFSNVSGPLPYSVDARVDQSGTGGLVDPSLNQRRLSFDEGDETAYLDGQYQGFVTGEDTSPQSTYQPSSGSSFHRPLPPPPQSALQETSRSVSWKNQSHNLESVHYPVAPDGFQTTASGALVPRSISLLSHSSTPLLVPPIRAKTDAEERKRQTMVRTSLYGYDLGGENLQPQSMNILGLDLPVLPAGKRFVPSKLNTRDFERCKEPWAISAVIAWLRQLAEGEGELREQAMQETLVLLFTTKIPNMNIADAETLSARMLGIMYDAGTLVKEEEWLKFGQGTTSGVLYQLTGKGCYGQVAHDSLAPGRCYSFHCQRTVKKIDARDEHSRRTGDWATFYEIKKEDTENVDKKEIERQNVLHEIVQTEIHYMEQLNVLRTLYRGALSSAQPPIIAPRKLEWFIQQVFGKLDPVQKANEDFLLPQLKYRQKEQGPWIVGFADIFRDWIRKAKVAYIDYASNYPNANARMRREDQDNLLFKAFLEGARNNKMSNKLDYNTFLKAPITRLQRYSLLLTTVSKGMTQESDEKTNLQTAIEEIKVVTMECDSRVAESGRKSELAELAARLVLRSDFKDKYELNLTHLGRELIFKGDVQRMGSTRFTWMDAHVLLFDNFMVLAKTFIFRETTSGPKLERYDVSKAPIPMDLLVLEGIDDAPVVKSSVKGITTVSASNFAGSSAVETRKVPTPGSLQHSNTNTSVTTINTTSSGKTMVTSTALEGAKDEKIMYPFRVRHLGEESYTLFAPTAANRDAWCDKIIEAKTRHAAGLFAQNAEPFKMKVLADTAFANDAYAGSQKSVLIKGTPLSRALKEVEKTYSNGARPGPICRARVNCATSFTQPYGKQMLAVGTDYGVYAAEKGNARGWTRIIPAVRVTQMAVLEEFNLFLLIADKSLIAYHIDVVCPGNVIPGLTPTPTALLASSALGADATHKAPQKLSGAKDVHFFVTGRLKDRTLIFYKKRDGLYSTFKILEPILAVPPSAHRRAPFRTSHSNPQTIAFRDYDEFYLPADCTSLSLFNHSLAISMSTTTISSSSATGKAGTAGFNVMNLDKKTPWTVPDLKAPHVAAIAQHLGEHASDAIAIFRLDENEFLCVYDRCAVYVNKHGDVSRSAFVDFSGRAKSASMVDGYLILFDNDFVEIRDATNGRLKQVIAGRDVRCLDDGRGGIGHGGSRTVKFALQHPDFVGCQVVMELVKTER